MQKPPAEIAQRLDDADEEALRATIAYCEAQIERDAVDDGPERDEEPPDEFEGDEEQWAGAVDGCEAPARATTTVKTINGNDYVYLQWSQDGKTESEYVAPVNPKR